MSDLRETEHARMIREQEEAALAHHPTCPECGEVTGNESLPGGCVRARPCCEGKTKDNIGSRRWWQVTPLYGAQGIADHILRLLEQEAISRRKAGELLAWGEHVRLHADGCPPHCERLSDPPGAPWDTLNWCDDVCPGDHIVECSCPCCGAHLDITHGDDPGEISVVGSEAPCAACEVEAASGDDYDRQHTCERGACPTCDGEGRWTVSTRN